MFKTKITDLVEKRLLRRKGKRKKQCIFYYRNIAMSTLFDVQRQLVYWHFFGSKHHKDSQKICIL